MTPRKIIIDTDPGRDDAAAILMALASPELEVLGLVTVAGNVPLRCTERNARWLVELAGRPEIPVYLGCDRPRLRKPITSEHVHGPTGLGDFPLPEPRTPLAPGRGVDFIVDTVTSSPPGTITLCTLGPLTNVATALIEAPRIAEKIREIVMMAGAYGEVGNIWPCAEYNVYADPHAAAVVFRSGIPITTAPLDITHQALSSPERIARIAAIGNDGSRVIASLLSYRPPGDYFAQWYEIGAPLHDACPVAYLLKPDLFGGRKVNVMIETTSELTLGMTVVDWWYVTDRPPNAYFLREIDADGFYALLTERLARLP